MRATCGQRRTLINAQSLEVEVKQPTRTSDVFLADVRVVRVQRASLSILARRVKFLLKLLALLDQQGSITAIVHQLVAAVDTRPRHHLLGAPLILWQCLALPSQDGATKRQRDPEC